MEHDGALSELLAILDACNKAEDEEYVLEAMKHTLKHWDIVITPKTSEPIVAARQHGYELRVGVRNG